jgi:hypothetical protein
MPGFARFADRPVDVERPIVAPEILAPNLPKLAIPHPSEQRTAHQITEIRRTGVHEPNLLAKGIIQKPDARGGDAAKWLNALPGFAS